MAQPSGPGGVRSTFVVPQSGCVCTRGVRPVRPHNSAPHPTPRLGAAELAPRRPEPTVLEDARRGPMPADLLELSALELARLIETREVSPVDVVQETSRRLDATEPILGAFVLRLDEEALAAARAAEGEIGEGRYRGPLHGIPVAIKDNIAVAGTVTAAGTRFLADNVTADDP